MEAPYPQALQSQGLAGEAVVFVDIDTSGAVERVTLQSATHPAFAEAALTTAAQLLFSPALVDNAPSPIRIEYRYNFAPAPVPSNMPTDPHAQIMLHGLVREAGTRVPVIGAAIFIDGNQVASTDGMGQFDVRTPLPPQYTLGIRKAAFEPYEVLEEHAIHERLDVKYYILRTLANTFQTVVRSHATEHEVSKISLTREELEHIPGTFGDPVRVIENLPGMGRAPALGGQLIVRGADPADTQAFVDGMPIPILYHFYGLTSVFDPEFLDRIDFLPGGFGARYGRATAGVVNIVTRDLQCETWRGSAKIDIIDASAFGCLPVGKWHLGFAVRRSYIDAILPTVLSHISNNPDEGTLTISPVYWDYQARAQTTWSHHAISLSAYGSDDDASIIRTGALSALNVSVSVHQGFHRLIAIDRWRPSDILSLTTTLSPAYQLQNFGSENEAIGLDDGFATRVYTIDWREELSLKLHPRVELTAGIDHSLGQTDLQFSLPVPTELQRFPSPVFDFTNAQTVKLSPGALEQGYWAEVIADLPYHIRLTPGVRLDYLSFENSRTLVAMPRLSVRWEVLPSFVLKAGYGTYSRLPNPQYLIPSFGNPSLSPELSQQYILGTEVEWPEWFSLDVQGFYNRRSQLAAASKNVTIAHGQATAQRYGSTGVGHTWGVQMLLRRPPAEDRVFSGWIAYTLSRTWREDLPVGATYSTGTRTLPYPANATQSYLGPYDQTHILTIIGQWQLPGRWLLGLRYRIVTGNPYTPSQDGRIFGDLDSDAYVSDQTQVQRDSARMPLFNQLDLRVDKTFIFDLWRLTAYLELINAYFAKNVEQYTYDYRYRDKAGVTLLPILPVLGVKGEF